MKLVFSVLRIFLSKKVWFNHGWNVMLFYNPMVEPWLTRFNRGLTEVPFHEPIVDHGKNMVTTKFTMVNLDYHNVYQVWPWLTMVNRTTMIDILPLLNAPIFTFAEVWIWWHWCFVPLNMQHKIHCVISTYIMCDPFLTSWA